MFSFETSAYLVASTIFLASRKGMFCVYFIINNPFSFFHISQSFELTVCFYPQFGQCGSCSQLVWFASLLPYLTHTGVLVHHSLP